MTRVDGMPLETDGVLPNVGGVLLDVDGVLVSSWEPLPGAADTLAWLRGRGLPFRCLTNTSQFDTATLEGMLRDGGLDVRPGELITSVVSTEAYLREHFAGRRAFLLASPSVRDEIDCVVFVEDDDRGPVDVVVIGDAEEDFTYRELNRAFRLLMDGAAFVAMHRNLYWRTAEGLTLDVGAFVAALEAASGVQAVVMGKPSPQGYLGALASMDVEPGRAVMVGDDVTNDILAAEAVGCTGVLVRTGKFREQDLERISPVTRVIDSIAGLPELLS